MQALGTHQTMHSSCKPVIATGPGLRAAAVPHSRLPTRSRQQVTRAEDKNTSTQDKPEIAKFADSVGLPTSEGLFGFKPFSEVWTGRLAMGGFLSSLIMEGVTGKGTLQQVGLLTPNPLLLTFILAATSGVTVFGTGRTIARAQTGNMSKEDYKRYSNFLGLKGEATNVAESQAQLKQKGDFTNKLSEKDIQESRKQGAPADRILDPRQPGSDAGSKTAFEDESNNPFARREAGPNQSLANKDDVVEQQQFSGTTARYARGVELTNGRWAMLGFLAAISVEAATGKGIISQIIWYAKLSNLLGPNSGF